jgi:HECT-domain (ubiquitin-transferase)
MVCAQCEIFIFLIVSNCFHCNAGCLEPMKCFCIIPPDALTKLCFCDQDFTSDDVIKALYPAYDDMKREDIDDKTREDICTHHQQLILSICPKTNDRHGILVDVLRERCVSNNDYLRDFVSLVTGSSYIPRSDFKITIEFNYEEISELALPVAHTCVSILKFPGLAYDGDREVFEKKLDQSMEYAKCVGYDGK